MTKPNLTLRQEILAILGNIDYATSAEVAAALKIDAKKAAVTLGNLIQVGLVAGHKPLGSKRVHYRLPTRNQDYLLTLYWPDPVRPPLASQVRIVRGLVSRSEQEMLDEENS